MSTLAEILTKHQEPLLSEWAQALSSSVRRADLMKDSELKQQMAELLREMTSGARNGSTDDLGSSAWTGLRSLLHNISSSRARQGFTASETATFVFALRPTLLEKIRTDLGKDQGTMFNEIARASVLLDKLGLLTTESFAKTREEVIRRQQQDMLELSTPVVKLWDGILALPLIGTLDSARTQVVMETLLQNIVQTNSVVAIIDITGVPTVDTLVAQHLLKTITAARLMGADCIVSGVRPQIAQTIVHLGVDLADVITKANLSDAFALALQRRGLQIIRRSQLSNPSAPQQPTQA